MKKTFIIALTVSACASQAFFDVYTDRTTWETALGAAPATTEDFSGFGADTDFSFGSVNINGGALSHSGLNDFRNLIETPSFEFTDNNGTNHASIYVDTDDLVTFTPDAPLLAYGADSWLAASSGGALADVYSGASLLGTIALSNTNGAFHGFLTDQSVTSIVYRTNSGSEGFGLDNVSTDAVPEPATMTLLGLGALAALRKKRKS